MRKPLLAVPILAALMGAQQAYRIPADEMTMTARPFSLGPLLESRSDLVEVPVVVRDRDHNPIGGLTQANFQLFDNGKQVPISSFSVETHAPSPGEATMEPLATKPGSAPGAHPPSLAPAPAPRSRYIVLFIDDLNTEPNDLANVSRAAQNYLKTGFQPGDHVAILSSTPVSTLDFTSNIDEAIATLSNMSFHSRIASDGGCPEITVPQAYEISSLFSSNNEAYEFALIQAQGCGMTKPYAAQFVHHKADSVWGQAEAQSQEMLAAVRGLIDTLSTKPGERTIILASAGFLTPTLQHEINGLIDRALRNNVVINGLDAKGLYVTLDGKPRGFSPSETPSTVVGNKFIENPAGYRDRTLGWDAMEMSAGMAQMAFGTGGDMFENSNDLPKGFRQLANPPDISYVLSYQPAQKARDGLLHKLSVRLNGALAQEVQYRPAYLAPSSNSTMIAATADLKALLDSAMVSTREDAAIPMQVDVVPASGAVRVSFRLDPRQFVWQSQGGRHVDAVTFVAALRDPAGKIIVARIGEMDLRLRTQSVTAISKPGVGLGAGMNLPIPRGAYSLRTVAHERNGNRTASLSQTVTIP